MINHLMLDQLIESVLRRMQGKQVVIVVDNHIEMIGVTSMTPSNINLCFELNVMWGGGCCDGRIHVFVRFNVIIWGRGCSE